MLFVIPSVKKISRISMCIDEDNLWLISTTVNWTQGPTLLNRICTQV